MATDLEIINAFLASAEVTTKWALAMQARCNELSRLTALVQAKGEELEEKERRISEIDDRIIKAGSQERHDQELHAAAQGERNEETNKLQMRNRELQRQCDERQAKLDNLNLAVRSWREKFGMD
jgi:hypothetical protein